MSKLPLPQGSDQNNEDGDVSSFAMIMIDTRGRHPTSLGTDYKEPRIRGALHCIQRIADTQVTKPRIMTRR